MLKSFDQIIKWLYSLFAKRLIIWVICWLNTGNISTMAKKETETKSRKGEVTPAEKSLAEYLYCEKRLSPDAIAKELGRNIKTIYKLRDEGGWEDTRELFDLSPTQLKRLLTEAAIRMAKGEKRLDEKGNELKEIDADAIVKVMKSRDYLQKAVNAAVCRDFLVELDNFVSKHNPKLAAENTQYHRMFLVEKIQQENGNN